ncbi:major facilitator superfamily [Chiua virens]|nr:major facilitator superfamily [Chiua virens]
MSSATLVDELPKQLSLMHKLFLLLILCFAQFLDAFDNAALFPAIPALEAAMRITESQSSWVISAFQLTFASFLFISGRMSDVYDPKRVFITGLSFLGILSIVVGFVRKKVVLIVLRACMGIASAMTIPSALTLLVHVFPDPLEQARAIAVFGGCGAGADALGLFVGALLVQYISYQWVFWFAATITLPVALASVFIIPSRVVKYNEKPPMHGAKWRSLDLFGISILTVALILFIYALTSGAADGWATAAVLTPLIVSILLIILFFYWETLIPIDQAAIPPRTWFYPNFCVLSASALLPFLWWNVMFMVFTTLWQHVFHWTVVSTAIRLFPIGAASFAMSFTGSLSRVFNPKWIILTGLSMVAVGTALIAVGGSQPEDYWTHVFPAFIIGSAGTMLTFSHTNIAIFQAAPASMAGTIGAIFNGALQIGSAVGLAAFMSIETSVEARHASDGTQEYAGRAAAFLFLLGIVLVEMLCVACFYKRETEHGQQV